MSLKKIQEEYRNTPRLEIIWGVLENYIFGFLGATMVVFISQRNDVLVLLGYMTYYFYLGRVVNRPKYITSLGKFIVFPVPTALGGYTGYKLGLILTHIFI